MQGCIKTATQSRCTMQRHKWLSMQDAATLMADEARMQNHTSTHRPSPYGKLGSVRALAVMVGVVMLAAHFRSCSGFALTIWAARRRFTVITVVLAERLRRNNCYWIVRKMGIGFISVLIFICTNSCVAQLRRFKFVFGCKREWQVYYILTNVRKRMVVRKS